MSLANLVTQEYKAEYLTNENFDIHLQESFDSKRYAAILTHLDEIFEGIEKDKLSINRIFEFIHSELLPEIKNEPLNILHSKLTSKDNLINHSINVTILSVRMADFLGLSLEKIEFMAFIALMHDIGKLLVKKELTFIRLPHYELAYEFLKSKNCTALALMSIRFQEEAFDGSGLYKITGDKQIIYAKILNICNYYETLLRTTKLTPYECFEKVQELVNTRFDPKIFKIFRDAFFLYNEF
jgi:HD-GYP domain-containing protein (c-di-GMP phosphodiesterase class II)